MTDDLLPWIAETYQRGSNTSSIFCANNRSKPRIELATFSDDFANIPDEYDSIDITGVITHLGNNVLKLLKLLNDDSRVWKHVSYIPIEDQPSSPAFFAVLTAAMKKTKSLSIECRLIDKGGYSCLASGLLTAGIQELELTSVNHLEEDFAKVLAEALVCTTYLKRLSLVCDLFGGASMEERVCDVFAEALKRNRSIQALELSRITNGTETLLRLLPTLQSHPKLQSLNLEYVQIEEVGMEELREWLSREDCKLQEFEIFQATQSTSIGTSKKIGGRVSKNKSLQRLRLECACLPSSDLESLCKSFPNLQVLELQSNNICDLSPLESLLCREDCKIQEMHLSHNQISRNSIMKFATKIPDMKSLKRLYFFGNPFLNDLASFEAGEKTESLRHLWEKANESKNLQRLGMGWGMDAPPKVLHTLNVNRGGRCGIEVESANCSISLSLWPKILHRASSIKYFNVLGREWSWNEKDDPSDESPRAAVVFSLLREHVHIFESIGKCDKGRTSQPASKKQRLE